MHIVIIDDEATVAETLAAAVRQQGHSTVVVCSATESLSVLAANPPDAVFLDLFMPELSGVEVLREIRRRNPDLPIVVVTGRAESTDLDEVRRLGVTDIVQKPWPLTHVDEALRSLSPDH